MSSRFLQNDRNILFRHSIRQRTSRLAEKLWMPTVAGFIESLHKSARLLSRLDLTNLGFSARMRGSCDLRRRHGFSAMS